MRPDEDEAPPTRWELLTMEPWDFYLHMAYLQTHPPSIFDQHALAVMNTPTPAAIEHAQRQVRVARWGLVAA